MRCRAITNALLLLLLFMIQGAFVSTAQKLSLEELVRQAEIIIRGRVAESKTTASSDASFLTTRIAVSVEEQFKGRKISSVTLTLPVGSMGDVAQGAPGTPEFALG